MVIALVVFATLQILACGAEQAKHRSDAAVRSKGVMDMQMSSDGKVSFLKDHSERDLIKRTVLATTPSSKTIEDCGGLDSKASSGWGAAYSWCQSALDNVVNDKERSLVGLSYGIFSFDTWSQHLANRYGVSTQLYDCFAKDVLEQYDTPYTRVDTCVAGDTFTDEKGRKFESLHEHLSRWPEHNILMKLDVEGSEWNALANLTDADLQKVHMLDMEFHLCYMTPKDPVEQRKELQKRVELLERLDKFFHVTQRVPPDEIFLEEKNTMGEDSTNKEICHMPLASISYVNKAAVDSKSGHKVLSEHKSLARSETSRA